MTPDPRQNSKENPVLAGLTGLHLIVLVAVILVIFGATKLPVFAKSLGQSVKIMRGELQSMHEPEQEPVAVATDAPTRTDSTRTEITPPVR